MNELIDLIGSDLPPEELPMLIETFAALAQGASSPAPSPSSRMLLLKATLNPVLAYAERVARLAQISAEQARSLLERLETDAPWEPGPEPGIFFLEVPRGPDLAGAVVGLVRVPPDQPFPAHEHLGDEQVMVLRGGIIDDSGRVHEAGDLLASAEGTEHSFRSAPGEELLYLSIIQEGVDFAPSGGPLILPRD